MNKGCISFLVALFFIAGCTKSDNPTPLEKSGYSELSKSNDINSYLNSLSNQNDFIETKIMDTTQFGNPLFLVKISENFENKKPAILFIAQQHGNEPSGKEGLLLLLKDLANGTHKHWLKKFDLYLVPQVNPDGGDRNKRRNACDIDLNRDHLLLESVEAKAVQDVYNELKPVVTVDLHEYYPFSDSWKEFGYRKNFDIQFGGLTNMNINENIRDYFYTDMLSQVKTYVESNGYSFFEYTLGNFARGERLRHSTVDVNDGRQSFGINNTMSFIVEGINGRDAIDNIKYRSHGQYHTAVGILNTIYKNIDEINTVVSKAREKNYKTDSTEKVSVRMDHFKGDKNLQYPLLSLKTNKDTVFNVVEFHAEVISLLDVNVPKAYLIPKWDKKLVDWLLRTNFEFEDYYLDDLDKIFRYKIVDLKKRVDEELENYYPEVTKNRVEKPDTLSNYYRVNTNQFYKYKIVTALEPQAMYGLINYPNFEYLIFDLYFSVLRIDY